MTREDEFLEIRDRLFEELVLLGDVWRQYELLFRSAKTVRLLNEHAQWFFATVQRVFIHEIVLSISRLTEGAESGGNRNVTLEALLQDPRLQQDRPLHKALSKRIQEVQEAAGPVRQHRNKAIAHRDHKVSLGMKSLPDLRIDAVGEVIDLMTEIHHVYGVRVLERDSDYDFTPLGGADALIEALASAPDRIKRLIEEEERDLKRLRELSERSGDGGEQG